MQPYYDHDGITIYHGDCREVLPGLEKVDLVLTDPPYGFGYYETDKAINGAVFIGLANLTCAFGYPETIAQWCIDVGQAPDAWLVWWPSNAGCKASRGGYSYTRETEHIAVWGKPGGALPRTRKSTRAIDPKAYGCLLDRRSPDVLQHPAPGLAFNSHLRRHPNEKPVPLMKSLLAFLGSGLVLDPFMGSGTTLRAAKDLGRRAIGIEIEERYCEIAAKRLSQGVLPFDP
jgi:site-specific DNA-methyltransferase (adenine-specific)